MKKTVKIPAAGLPMVSIKIELVSGLPKEDYVELAGKVAKAIDPLNEKISVKLEDGQQIDGVLSLIDGVYLEESKEFTGRDDG